ncbi:hypothetical protein RB2501_13739 [Robiginitalea biformata HTCC2501]|uniref:Uncharacterized protein n=1 Tax=Robiginitalea biformata (strain ATCC BAA-864 / DSM 15991 / KCTC 12146 / HTCC2501) TaxID=313596 RepID=A4CKJ5_ROBBH|nr:hypothetical protein RB2501_13739 [Robiginitalea biformata HTCC2501]
MQLKDEMKEKMVWKRAYTLVILLNILYILVFYYIMITNA